MLHESLPTLEVNSVRNLARFKLQYMQETHNGQYLLQQLLPNLLFLIVTAFLFLAYYYLPKK